MKAILFAGGLSLALTLLGTRVAIRMLAQKGYAELIHHDGPTSHRTRRGIPTMGGLVVMVSVVLAYAVAKLTTGRAPSASAVLLLGLLLALGAIGLLDDYVNTVKQRALVLRRWLIVTGQVTVAATFSGFAMAPFLANDRGVTPASQSLSFTREADLLALPAILIPPLIVLMIAGASNGVHVTDALDGLATGACVIVFGAYTFITIWQTNQSCAVVEDPRCYEVRDPLDLAIVAAALTGSCFGFLWWNAPPAKISMGQTGSLALGGALAGLAILTRTELLSLVLGGLFVSQTASVLLQVAYFKVTGGRRLFRMAPLHHHFQLMGWDEMTVVVRFWILTGLSVAAGLGMFYAEWVVRL